MGEKEESFKHKGQRYDKQNNGMYLPKNCLSIDEGHGMTLEELLGKEVIKRIRGEANP